MCNTDSVLVPVFRTLPQSSITMCTSFRLWISRLSARAFKCIHSNEQRRDDFNCLEIMIGLVTAQETGELCKLGLCHVPILIAIGHPEMNYRLLQVAF